MAIEHACIRVVRKPWGSTDLRPWSKIDDDGIAIGELWFQRAAIGAPEPALLLKLLFTKEPLSIQVHPDDAFAQSIGLAHGKTEAWYVLAAAPDATVAVGLKRQLTAAQLRASIEDGSILDLVRWRRVAKDDVIFIPAGTIHAIGAGLVIAEIQQRSDTTFRLFDHGRRRELHVDNAVAAATAAPAENQPAPRRLTDARTLLVVSPQFVLERIDLPPRSSWRLDAKRETWVLVIEGQAQAGLMDAFVGESIFLESDRTSIKAGPAGLKGLVAYPGPDPLPDMLHNIGTQSASSRSGLTEVRT
ncbi:MAG: mannose-6-phosphate isomerase [Alphaproteobacteria bacterium]|nr:mannose-6-phosphate isomerase [Alphaproteobacteria bacterium]